MDRRQFIGVGAGVVAGAAVGAAGSRFGSGLATDGQLVAMATSRGLSGDEARGALQTTVPPGKYDPYYMFASGGHLGQVQVIGVPSMRLLKVIPVFTRRRILRLRLRCGHGRRGDPGRVRSGQEWIPGLGRQSPPRPLGDGRRV